MNGVIKIIYRMLTLRAGSKKVLAAARRTHTHTHPKKASEA